VNNNRFFQLSANWHLENGKCQKSFNSNLFTVSKSIPQGFNYYLNGAD